MEEKYIKIINKRKKFNSLFYQFITIILMQFLMQRQRKVIKKEVKI